MKSLILSIVAILSISTVAQASETQYAKDTLPTCDSAAKIVIFHGESFEGTVYLHDADVVLSKSAKYAVRQIAELGQTPVICQDSGTVVVTSAESGDSDVN